MSLVVAAVVMTLHVAREGMSGWAGTRRARRRLGRLRAGGAVVVLIVVVVYTWHATTSVLLLCLQLCRFVELLFDRD